MSVTISGSEENVEGAVAARQTDGEEFELIPSLTRL